MSQRTHSGLSQKVIDAVLAEVRSLARSGRRKEAADLFDKHFPNDHPNPVARRKCSTPKD
jgi:hypothetical protein